MAGFLKKQGAAFYFNALAILLGIAGLVAMVISGNITNAYALNSIALLVLAAVGALALVAVATYMPNRLGNHNYASAASVVVAIALFGYILGNTINERILLISGLFTYNSGNMVGWSVFYAAAASWACFLVAILLLIMGSFMRSVKEPSLV